MPACGEPASGRMEQAGIDRRTVLRWGAYVAGVLALPGVPFAERIAAAETAPRLPVVIVVHA